MSWWHGTGSHPSSLTVSGVDVIDSAPLDLSPITWTDIAGESWGNLNFTVQDTAANRSLQGGAVVNLRYDSTHVFGGTLVRRSFGRLPGAGRTIECEVVSHDAWLDWRIVPRWSSRTDLGNRIRKLTSDRSMVKDLIERRGGPLKAPNATVTETATGMDVVRAVKLTLREALELVADEAQTEGTPGTRRFYVDERLRLHWYNGLEGTAAPYRIADGSYVRDVITTSGLVEYWSLREDAGTVNYGSQGVADLTLAGSYTQAVTAGVVNDPQYRAVTLTATGRSVKTSAPGALFPGDTFSLELWFKRSTLGTTQVLITSSGAPNTGPQLSFSAANVLTLTQQTAGNDWVATAAITDTSWHHLAVTHSPGVTDVYLDGAAITGTTTARVFGSGTTWQVGHATTAFVGTVQHVGVYSTKLSAATALAHYNQGISIAPEDLTLEDDWGEVMHHAYVVGKNAAGSGWVYNTGSDFELGAIQEFVERERADRRVERNRAGKAHIRRHGKARGLTFKTRVAGTWRAGQTVTVTDDSFGLAGDTFEIRAVNASLGPDGIEYDIEAGMLRRRLTRRRRRR